jgi:hypothetical protein
VRRPDVAERNRGKKFPWPASCEKCGGQRKARGDGKGYRGRTGRCENCYQQERRSAWRS